MHKMTERKPFRCSSCFHITIELPEADRQYTVLSSVGRADPRKRGLLQVGLFNDSILSSKLYSRTHRIEIWEEEEMNATTRKARSIMKHGHIRVLELAISPSRAQALSETPLSDGRQQSRLLLSSSESEALIFFHRDACTSAGFHLIRGVCKFLKESSLYREFHFKAR